MRTYPFAFFSPVAMLTCTAALAQSPGVLELQKTYHIGIYSMQVDAPGGALTVGAAEGSMALDPSGQVTSAFSLVELTSSSATVSSLLWNATYDVRPDGEMIFDFDANNPGTNLLSMWTNTDGSVLHTTRQNSTVEAATIIAIEKGVGLSTATLSGTYYLSGHSSLFSSGIPNAVGNWGTISFDGVGTATFNQTVLFATPSGTTTMPLSGPVPYSVSADGRLDLNGGIGGVRSDGEVWYIVFGDTSGGGTVQITAGVRTGGSYNHGDLAGRHSLATTSLALGSGPFLPQTNTDYGEFLLLATSATAGTFSSQGATVNGTPAGVAISPLVFSGASSLLPGGELTLNGSSRSFAVGFASDGQFFTGRETGNTTSFVFGMRQCLASNPYGTGTAGSGGVTPVLGMKTFPVLGNSGFQLIVTDAIGGGVGIVALSGALSPGLPALGGLILIDPLAIGYSATIFLSGSPGVAGDGAQVTPIPIPPNPTLTGFRMFAQGLILDAGAPADFAMTNGFEIVLCN